jgi:endoglucanase Acf2
MRCKVNTALFFSFVLLLQACGGGGGGGSDNSGGGGNTPPVNQAPSLTINAEIDILEGSVEVATASGTDPENQALTYSIIPSADSDLFSISTSGVISFLTAPDYEAPADANGDNSYELSVELSDSQNASDSQGVVVTVLNAIEGRVIDAPMSGSEIYIINTGDSAANAGESAGSSDSQGYFRIPAPADSSSIQIMTRGGTDTKTGVVMPDLILMSDLPEDSDADIAITPISSVIASAATPEDKAAVLAALGVNGSVDEFLTTDIWALAETGDTEAQSLQATNQQIGLLISTAQTLLDDGSLAELSAVAEAVVEAIASEAVANGDIDLQSDTVLADVLTEALPSVSAAVVEAVSANIAGINELLAGEGIDPTSAQAADFVETAQTALQDAVKDLVSGVSAIEDFVAEADLGALFADNEVFSSQTDTDNDGTPNLNDTDDDGDGVSDDEDAFPLNADESLDTDGDSIGNNADADDDGDGVADDADAFPLDDTEALDYDNDDIGNNADPDDDNDGVNDSDDAFPLNADETLDTDGDTIGNNADTDDDGDGIADVDDDTPLGGGDALAVLVDGVVADIWGGNAEFSAFDSEIGYSDCTDESAGTETCPSIDWAVIADAEKGDVLEVSYSSNAGHAGIVIGPSGAVNLSDYANGQLEFDIRVLDDGAASLSGGFQMKLETTLSAYSIVTVSDINASGDWQAVSIPLSTFTCNGDLNLSSVTAPLVFFPADKTAAGVEYRIDNVRFTGIADGSTAPTDNSGCGGSRGPTDYTVESYGAGSIADTIYTASHRCKDDNGYWVENAGVISTKSEIQIQGCNQGSGIPTGVVTKLYPQLTGPAAQKPTQTHKWWGSVSFLGEMTVGDPADAAYITPDPIIARISNKGARVMGIPSGLRIDGDKNFFYPIPDHAVEVYDGVAIGNSDYPNLEAYTKDHSAGSVTVLWKSGNTDVMEATFVHGSPYIYFKAYSGDFEIRTLSPNGGEKGTFDAGDNALGIWTNVAGNINNYLIVGEGATTFGNTSGNEIEVNNSAKEMTLVYLPHLQLGSVPTAMVELFASKARNTVAAVDIDYQVNDLTNEITVTHSYLDDQDNGVNTIAGMHPLHWKNTSQTTTNYKVRTGRGMVKFAETDQFSYQIPYVGVLPTLPVTGDSLDQAVLEDLVTEFINQGSGTWNAAANGVENTDTYWSGKSYGKVAELAAIADSLDMQSEASQLINWLKTELEDWFTAETDGTLNTKKYFVYDDDWNTLFGFDESFGSHQRLADHHFHYGYFVRAAAEICRLDPAWCGEDQYGPMIELLIRDYAADKDDPLFPHMRNFDMANGFSWADGQINFTRGNNNESTSEAATAYGAIILYGLVTGNNDLVEKGMYLHASTGAAYWEYWNNIDGYNNVSADADNFPDGYNKITTSIIWGDGAVFSTWFSPAYAHILGIQGLPSSPLILHVGLHGAYMEDYVALGLSESSNGKPSGLIDDQWRDLWWNLWAMVDADASIADYNSVSSYEPEAGESKAHTYHWLHTFKALGRIKTGTGELTSDYPAALAFVKDGVTNYVVYNFTDQDIAVRYSDGNTITAAPGFTLASSDTLP